MSISATEVKRRSLTHSYLLSASNYLDGKSVLGFPNSPVQLAEVEEKLTEHALVNGLRELIDQGNLKSPQAAFWKNLSGAAEAIGQAELSKELHARFLLAVTATTGCQP